MTKTHGGLIAVILVLLLGVSVYNTFLPPPTVYEYRIEEVPDGTFTDTVNKIGAEGWDMIFARRATSGSGNSPEYEIIFKRQKRLGH